MSRAGGLSVWRLPIYWLFLGPPIFRAAGSHDATASLEGSFDVWSLIRVAWWLFFGALALLELNRHRRQASAFLRSLGLLPWWAGAWLASIFVSVLPSPAPIFTFANAALMALLAIAAIDLGLKLASGRLPLLRAIGLLHNFAVLLLLIVAVVHFIQPGRVGVVNKFGPRIMGGEVADVAISSLVVFFSALFLILHSRGLLRLGYWFTLLLGILGIGVAQTRTAYVTFFVGLIFFTFQYILKAPGRRQRFLLALMCLLVSALVGLAIYADVSHLTGVYQEIGDYLVRNPETLQSMSGRDGISALVIRDAGTRPFGLGYSAGPRALIGSSDNFLAEYGVVADRIGNAHNMYVEVLGGSGMSGAIAWLGLLVLVLVRLVTYRGESNILIRVLLFTVLAAGLTSSGGVLPFTQASGLLWVLVAFASALRHPGLVSLQSLQVTRPQ